MRRDRIGFDRKVRRAWLDRAALLAHELRDADTLHSTLSERLSGEIDSDEVRRKTVNVLTRIWWRVPREHIPLRDEALDLIAQSDPDKRLALHWGMALLAYPIFQDVATIAGRLLRLQGVFNLSQLKRRINAEWGDRTTLEYAILRILASQVDWDVLQRADEAGSYQAGRQITLSNQEPALWLLEIVLRTRPADLPLNDLLRAPELYAFLIPLSTADLLHSDRFKAHQQGQNMLIIQPAGET